MSLARAGTFLVLSSARNRVRQAIRKLRQPRYLVGAAAMLLYVFNLAFRTTGRHGPGLDRVHRLSEVLPLGIAMALTLLAAITVFSTWTLGRDRLSFSFTEAEATWLLSGPLTRRDVIRYKVVVGLLKTLLSAFLVTLVFRRGMSQAVHLTAIPLFVGTLLGFGITWLHSAFASLVRVRWRRDGVSVSRRVMVGFALLGGYALVGALAEREAGPPPVQALLEGRLSPGMGLQWLEAVAHAPVAGWVLVPARAFLGAAQAESLGLGLHALFVLALLFALLLAAVLILDVPVEEAALASAERRARLDARRGRRGIPTPTLSRAPPLSALGRPELALTWKNLIALRRVYGARLGLSLAVMAVAVGFGGSQLLHAGRSGGWRLLAALVVLALAAITAFLGPLRFRTDLRSDLRRLDVLRSLPLSGLQVVRGELLAPALLLGASEIALLALALGLSAGSPIRGFSMPDRVCWTLGAMLLLPMVSAGMLTVQNAVALVFPSLLVDDEERSPRGVEAMGTRLLTLGASLLLLSCGFLPGAAFGVLVGGLAHMAGAGPFAYTLGCATVASILAVELLFALRFMGLGLERLDPTTA